MYPGHLSTNRLQRSQLGGNPLAHSQGGGGASFLATSANPPPPHVLRTNLPPAANPMATIVQQPAPEQPPIYTLPQPENPPISSGFVAVSDQPVDSNSNDDLLSEPALGGSQILQGPEKFDELEFAALLQTLDTSSRQHESIVKKKGELLSHAQTLSGMLWSFQTLQRRANATCGDGNPVAYSYQEQLAQFNEQNFQQMNEAVKTIHQVNIRPLWLSLFEQTSAELSSALYVHRAANSNVSIETLRAAMNILSLKLASEKEKPMMSPQTAAVLRGMYMYIGTRLVESSYGAAGGLHQVARPAQQAQKDLLSMTGIFDMVGPLPMPTPMGEDPLAGDDMNTNGNGHRKSDNPSSAGFLLEKAILTGSAQWATILLQPTLADLVNQSWLSIVADNDKTILPELDYVKILGQVPWNEIGNLILDNVKHYVLVPLQKLLQVAGQKGMLILMNLICKISAFISRVHPDLSLSCVAILSRSAWPSKMLCIPTLRYFVWDKLSMNDLGLVLAELYQLFDNKRPATYATFNAHNRFEHREFMAHFMINNQHYLNLVYQLDGNLAQRNEGRVFALLFVLAELAVQFQHSKAIQGGHVEIDVARLVIDELFYFGLAWQTNNPRPSPAIVSLRTEAQNALRFACAAEPHLLSYVIAEAGLNLPTLNHAAVAQWMTTIDMSEWVIDEITTGWLGYFLTHRTHPTLPEPGSGNYQMQLDSIITAYLVAHPQFPIPPALGGGACQIACSVFDLVHWEHAPSNVILRALLILMASDEVVSAKWRYEVCKKFLRTGIDTAFLGASAADRILRVEPKNDIAALIQAIIAIDFAKVFYANKALAITAGVELAGTDRGVRWLVEWGLFRRISLDAARNALNPHISMRIVADLCDVIRKEPIREAFAQVQKFLVTMRGAAQNPKSFKEFISRLIIRTLSDVDEFASWVTFWSYTLLPLGDLQNIGEDSFDDQLGVLAHGLFANHVDFAELEKLVPRKAFTLGQLESALKQQKYWLVFLALHGYQPRLPPPRRPDMHHPDKGFHDTALWMWKEAAMRVKDDRLAMVFWIRFFLLYFEACAMHADRDYFPQAWRETLNKHFTTCAQSFQGNEDRPLHQLYYAFTTWSKDVILINGTDFADVQSLVLRQLRPPFPRPIENLPALLPPPEPVAIHKGAGLAFAQHMLVKETVEGIYSGLAHRVQHGTTVADQELRRYKVYLKDLRQNFSQLRAAASHESPQEAQFVEFEETDSEQSEDEEEDFFAQQEPQESYLLPPDMVGGGFDYKKKPQKQKRKRIVRKPISAGKPPTVPAREDLKILLQQYTSIVQALAKLDEDHLTMLRDMYQNEATTSPVTLECDDELGCGGPARVNVQINRIVQPASVVDAMKSNRDEFSKIYFTLFSVARLIANTMSQLSDMAKQLVFEGASSRTLALTMFFELLPMVLQGMAPLYSPVTTALINQVLLPLGKHFIQGQADAVQQRLLTTILTKATKLHLTVVAPKRHQAPPSPLASSGRAAAPLVPGLGPVAVPLSPPSIASEVSEQQRHLQSIIPLSASSLSPLSTNRPDNSGSHSPISTNSLRRTSGNQLGPQFVETRADLYELLTPYAFLAQRGDSQTYVAMLKEFLSAKHMLMPEEESIIASQFEIQHSASRILQSECAMDLYDVLELSAKKPSFSAFSSTLLPPLVQYAYPHSIGKVIHIILGSPQSGLSSNWEFFPDDWLEPSMLGLIAAELPLMDKQLEVALKLAKRIVYSPVFRTDLASENAVIYIGGKASDSPAWELLEALVRAALQPFSGKKASFISPSAFYSLVGFVADVVASTPSLVNRIWFLYLDIFAPFIMQFSSEIDMLKVEAMLAKLPWYQATFHYEDPKAVVSLASALDLHSDIVRLLFASLDWQKFADDIHKPPVRRSLADTMDLLGDFSDIPKTEPSEEISYAGRGVLHFLKLFIEMNIAAPDSIPGAIRSRVLSCSTKPDNWYEEGNYLFDWRLIPEEEFDEVFGKGKNVVLHAIVKANRRITDPTTQVMECIKLLSDIARYAASARAILAAMREARSIMFICFSALGTSRDNHYWFLPPQSHIDIVNGSMLALVQQFHSIQIRSKEAAQSELRAYASINYEPLAILFSTVKGRPGYLTTWDWGQPYLAPIKFWNANFIPRAVQAVAKEAEPTVIIKRDSGSSKPDLKAQVASVNEVIYGLISRFCVVADPELSLAILHQAHVGIGERLPVLMTLFEDTLRGFLINTNSKSPLREAILALELPNVHLNLVVDACIQSHTALALRMILEQQKHYIAKIESNEWQTFMLSTMSHVTKFSPLAHHEPDLFGLWFYIMEAVADQRWHATTASQEKMEEIFSYLSGFCDPPSALRKLAGAIPNAKFPNVYVPMDVEPNVQLAAKAVVIFLRRVLVSKDREHRVPMTTVDPAQLFDKLMSLKTDAKFSQYNGFFNSVQSILSPLEDVTTLELNLVKDLAPVSPHLLNFIDAKQEDLVGTLLEK